jgi:hypothetical protein
LIIYFDVSVNHYQYTNNPSFEKFEENYYV